MASIVSYRDQPRGTSSRRICYWDNLSDMVKPHLPANDDADTQKRSITKHADNLRRRQDVLHRNMNILCPNNDCCGKRPRTLKTASRSGNVLVTRWVLS
jgi:hypothetical protein